MDTVYTRTFHRAVDTAGSVANLADVLDVSAEEIEAWADGRTDPPHQMFLRAIDIVAACWSAPRRAARS